MSEQKTMNVIGFFEGLPIEATHSFIDQKKESLFQVLVIY